ncbi:MAG: hypothetical protein ABW185_18000 [Sedimenticola sp.]
MSRAVRGNMLFDAALNTMLAAHAFGVPVPTTPCDRDIAVTADEHLNTGDDEAEGADMDQSHDVQMSSIDEKLVSTSAPLEEVELGSASSYSRHALW